MPKLFQPILSHTLTIIQTFSLKQKLPNFSPFVSFFVVVFLNDMCFSYESWSNNNFSRVVKL